MRHRLILPGAVLALAGSLWQGACHVNAQPVDTRPGASGPATARPPSQSRPRGNELKKAAPTDPSAQAERWSQADIDAARSRCTALIAGLDIVAIPAEPLKEGDCGTPAPVQLISIGAAPQISLSPPPLVTCELASALAGWLEAEVQPAAQELLGGAVIRLEVMSAYSCRNAYARRNGRLSEHGRANALDIAMFVTERGEIAHLRSDWGDTDRDIRARSAGPEKETEPATVDEGTTGNAVASRSQDGPDALRGTIAAADTAIGPLAKPLSALNPNQPSPILGLTPPSRLGGPRQVRGAELPPRQRFLRRIHAAACRHFGTVLGPEANEAHRNHFHLDMAERPVRRICE